MPEQVVTLGRAIGFFERHLDADRKAPSTRKAYVNAVTLLEHALGRDILPGSITIEDLEAIISSWRHLDANTVRNRLVAWREFFKWGSRRYGWPRLADEISLPRRSKPALRLLTHDEVSGMLAAPAVERARTTVWVLAYSAIRIGELIPLRWRNADLVAGRLTITHHTAKGRKGRVVPMPEELVAYLAHVKDERGDQRAGDDCYIVPRRRRAQFIPEDEAIVWNEPTSQMTIGRILKAVADLAGVRAADEITAHMFRRFYLTAILNDGTSDFIAAAIAGHESIQTTAGYAGRASLDATSRAVRGLSFGAPSLANRVTKSGRTWDRTKAPSHQPVEADDAGPARPETGSAT